MVILSSKGSTPPGGVAGPTGISMTLQNAPKTLTPPDGVPAPTDTSRTLSLQRDSTHRDGVGARMAISTTLLRSRYMTWLIPHEVTKMQIVLEPES